MMSAQRQATIGRRWGQFKTSQWGQFRASFPYRPNYFKRGLDDACVANNPVPFVARICRHATDGFDIILAARRPDLTVEALVVSASKPYHDLFTDATVQLSEERLRQFEASGVPTSGRQPTAQPSRAGERTLLHDAITRVLREEQRPMSSRELADTINLRTLYVRPSDGRPIEASQVSGRVRSATYRGLFQIDTDHLISLR
jgi:hypothetical protein